MYSRSHSRNQKLNLLSTAISSFKSVKANPQSKKTNTLKEKSFYNAIKEIKSLREEILPVRHNSIRSLLKNSCSRFQISSFTLMEHNFRENTHSNILEYLFDYNLIGPFASEILASFITNISPEFSGLARLIKKNQYEISREFPVKDGRIDLLILDITNKFVIVIENKLLASVSVKTSGEESSFELNKTQLTNYIHFINLKYPNFKKAFILLSYLAIDNPEKYLPFISANYNLLSQVLDEFNFSNDNIFIEYKLLLKSLGNFNPKELKSLRRNYLSTLRGENISNYNLNSIEQIRILINAHN